MSGEIPKKLNILIILIIVGIVAGLIFAFIALRKENQTPQTAEEIQREIERINKILEQVKEDKQKSESGEVACILTYDPVCGVNGRTYSNSCFAGVAGVEVAHQGECK